MKILLWIVGLPLLLLAAFFAIANRDPVTISLWPVAEPLAVPLFVAIVAPLYVGVMLGAVAAWLSGHRNRARARGEARRAETLQRDNAALKARIEALESAARTPHPASTASPLAVPPPAFPP